MKTNYFLPLLFFCIAGLIGFAAKNWYGATTVVPSEVEISSSTTPSAAERTTDTPTAKASSIPSEESPQKSSEADKEQSKVSQSNLASSKKDYVDYQLRQVFVAITEEKWDQALQLTEGLIEKYPNYRLAYLIRGDLYLAKTRPLSKFGATADEEKLVDLRAEAKARLLAYQERPPLDLYPAELLQLSSKQKYAIVVDTAKSRLYLYKNQGNSLQLANDYYVTQGKLGAGKMVEGDKRTPLGVYRITSSLNKATLGALYGDGAFPLNYPNEWDKRQNRHGSGIWLHGTPHDTFSRAPQASDGCVVLTNQDLLEVEKNIEIGVTPVIVVHGIKWQTKDKIAEEREDFIQFLDKWKKDWESRDIDNYLLHYSETFNSGSQDKISFAAHKRQIIQNTSQIKLSLNDVSILKFPPGTGGEVILVEFTQDYRSNILQNLMRKKQYWLKESGTWKIIYEGAV